MAQGAATHARDAVGCGRAPPAPRVQRMDASTASRVRARRSRSPWRPLIRIRRLIARHEGMATEKRPLDGTAVMRAPIRGREKPIRASATTRRSRPARRTRSWKPRLRIPSRTRPRPPMPAAICSRGARALMESWASIWPGDPGRSRHAPSAPAIGKGRPAPRREQAPSCGRVYGIAKTIPIRTSPGRSGRGLRVMRSRLQCSSWPGCAARRGGQAAVAKEAPAAVGDIVAGRNGQLRRGECGGFQPSRQASATRATRRND